MLPPVLLTTPQNCGTLAAARCLGALGYPVWMASDAGQNVPAMRSRFVSRRLDCPSLSEPEALLAWLCDFGRKNPGTVLYPTSDDFAWFQAMHADALAPHFKLYAPSVKVLDALLDKHSMNELCKRVGVATPPSAAPRTDAELEEAARTLPLPVLIKQRTQLFSKSRDKGVVVHTREELVAKAKEYRSHSDRVADVSAELPEATLPVLQTYYPEGMDRSLQVSGFIDETGELFVTRAVAKLLQRPRRMGLSLCLEDEPVPPALAEGIRALCREAGYFGVFELEFLRVGGQHLLIDFNPRYYHYMGFCIARGMPLPLFTTLAARGEQTALREAVQQAVRAQGSGPKAFCYRSQLEEMLLLQGLARSMTPAEVLHWVRWYRQHRHEMNDPMDVPGDRLPHFLDLAAALGHHARHPRSFLRMIVLDR